MDRVKVTYIGERAAPMRYMIRPGGKTYTAQGYLFGKVKATNLLLPDEAEVLADLDGDSGVTQIVRGKEVKLKNRDLVTVSNDQPLPVGDAFNVDLAQKPKRAVATKKGDEK